jgi:hypothetical protein
MHLHNTYQLRKLENVGQPEESSRVEWNETHRGAFVHD